jgi:hypothetical protein
MCDCFNTLPYVNFCEEKFQVRLGLELATYDNTASH